MIASGRRFICRNPLMLRSIRLCSRNKLDCIFFEYVSISPELKMWSSSSSRFMRLRIVRKFVKIPPSQR